MIDVLPSSLLQGARSQHGAVRGLGLEWVPVFCASCGSGPHGHVVNRDKNFAFYLCDPCFENHGVVAGTMAVPDEVFWAKAFDAQLENDGRILAPHEVAEAENTTGHYLAKLARDRA